jgi:hypothetical protein
MIYGKEWIKPVTSNINFCSWKFIEKWSDEDWPYAVRFYDKSGKLNAKATLNHLNKYSKKKLTQLPEDNDL